MFTLNADSYSSVPLSMQREEREIYNAEFKASVNVYHDVKGKNIFVLLCPR